MEIIWIIAAFIVYLCGFTFTDNFYGEYLDEKYSEALFVFLLAIFWPITYIGHLLFIIGYYILVFVDKVGDLGTKLGKRINS
ncbi:MAG: hypothetical protein CL840_16245 [Crocinitomicaceae bacterium]|mgnify:CR=1 FL=1|nr:hypothetical protein [Crocinitomicaceae bacterium]|tara:strand:- start:8792 stop:9037 length:246 start_codon:yes stop_codon:yes gene_type:complete